ncbi:MAG: hypothetical protein R3E68_16925 [Burkholderiaceae bacterium]
MLCPPPGNHDPNQPARITVLGSGFAGLSNLRELRHRDRAAELTLVAPRARRTTCPASSDPERLALARVVW